MVGARDTAGLVKPFAFVVAPNGVAPERLVAELSALAAERLATYQRPRHIAVGKALARTGTRKVQRFVLKARAEAR